MLESRVQQSFAIERYSQCPDQECLSRRYCSPAMLNQTARSASLQRRKVADPGRADNPKRILVTCDLGARAFLLSGTATLSTRSEEHTSELQSLAYLVCRLLL